MQIRLYNNLIIRSLAVCLAFGQLFWLVAPAQAQGYYLGDPRTTGYFTGVPTISPYAGYSYASTGPQYGYSAYSGSAAGRGAGIGIGLGLYGGMLGIGALSMASQMMARRGQSKNHNNPNKDQKVSSKERRQKQELALKGELDSDYQKELAEKGMVGQANPASQMPGMKMPGAAPAQSFGGNGSAPAMAPGAPADGFSGNQSMGLPASPPAGQFENNNFGSGLGAPAAAEPAPVLNTPWTP